MDQNGNGVFELSEFDDVRVLKEAWRRMELNKHFEEWRKRENHDGMAMTVSNGFRFQSIDACDHHRPLELDYGYPTDY